MKYIGLLLLTLSYFIPSINEIITKEINYTYVSSVVCESFYSDIKEVSTDSKIIVKDYSVYNELLYVVPINGEVNLPFGVMINKKYNNYLEVNYLNYTYKIYNLDIINVNIYQYVKDGKLGTTKTYFIVEGDNLDILINGYQVAYEQV